MFWPVGYRHCKDIMKIALETVEANAAQFVPDRNPEAELLDARRATFEMLSRAETLSVAFLDGRLIRVDSDVALILGAGLRNSDDLQFFFWDDEFAFDDRVANRFLLAYQEQYESLLPRPRFLDRFLWVHLHRLYLERPLLRKLLRYPLNAFSSKPQELDDAHIAAARVFVKVAKIFFKAQAMRDGQLVLEDKEFQEITGDFRTGLLRTQPDALEETRRGPGRPSIQPHVVNGLRAMFPDGPPTMSREEMIRTLTPIVGRRFSVDVLDRARAEVWRAESSEDCPQK